MQRIDDPENLQDRALNQMLAGLPRPQVRGSFADNVLRQIRMELDSETNAGDWFRRSWKMLAGITASVALIASSLVFQGNHANFIAQENQPDVSNLIASVPVSDLNELRDLDMSVNDNDIWLGTVSY